MSKKVLIINYYWSPSGGVSAQRWLKFCTYLPEYDITPIVYIPSNPSYPLLDESTLKQVPMDIEIISHPIKEPYRLSRFFSKKKTDKMSTGILSHQSFISKFLIWIRGNLFIPDARKYWIKPSVKYLEKYIRQNDIDTIISTGPPHSLHLIGLGLKKRFPSIRWIADFRDPWTTIGYHKELLLSSLAKRKHLKLESLVLRNADHIITTSWGTQREFSTKTKQPIEVITNGFEHVYQSIPLYGKFTLSHVGSLTEGRNPDNLWQAISELIEEIPTFKDDLQINLAGVVSSIIHQKIKDKKLLPYTKILGYIDHQKAIKLMRKSHVLLVIEVNHPNSGNIIAGKLFDYLATTRPIIGIGPEQWDVQQIVNQTETGKCFSYNDIKTLKEQIKQHYQDYLSKSSSLLPKNITAYQRRQLTGQLAQIISKPNE